MRILDTCASPPPIVLACILPHTLIRIDALDPYVSRICSSFFHVRLPSPRSQAVLCCHTCRIIRGRRGPSTSAVQCIPTHPYTAPLSTLLLLLLQYCFSVRRPIGPCSPLVECQIYYDFPGNMHHFGGLCNDRKPHFSLLVSVSHSRAHRTREFEVIHGSGITQDYGYVR